MLIVWIGKNKRYGKFNGKHGSPYAGSVEVRI